ncbi:MAG: glutamyl-tRNA reductase [Deltaproteobacteria bacterium]|nr:glutamyl-tRNA reductase [Deltaproteobacteria bacterium]
MGGNLAKRNADLLIVGLNHRSAPVEVRERLAFNNGTLEPALRRLVDTETVREGMILSTCNRVEIITSTADVAAADVRVKEFLAETQGASRAAFEEHLYTRSGKDALVHLFRVAASLDSLVVGEPQILGQVKDAYAAATEVGTLGEILHRCFHKTFAVAKRVRSETRIAAKAVSVSSAAVELARSIFDHLHDKTAMVIGAGEIGELAVRHLQNHGIGKVLVTNRTYSRAVELAQEFNGTVVPFEQFPAHLPNADIIIGSAGGNDYLVGPTIVQEALRGRKRRPMFFIDLGVPRNFDPRLNDIENIFLYDIDDLQQVIEENKDEREREAQKAEAIVAEEVESFWQWLSGLEVTPTIVALREKAEAIRQRELERVFAALKELPPHAQKAIEALSLGIVNKLLHPPIAYLKSTSRNGETDNAREVAVVRRIFGLDNDSE